MYTQITGETITSLIKYKKSKNSSGQTKLFPWFTNQRGNIIGPRPVFSPSYRRSSQVRNHPKLFWNHQQAIFPVGLFKGLANESCTGFGQRLVKKREIGKFGNDQMLWLLCKTRIKTLKIIWFLCNMNLVIWTVGGDSYKLVTLEIIADWFLVINPFLVWFT